MMPSAEHSSLDGTLDWRDKGLWLPDRELGEAGLAAAGPWLFDGPFAWPVMVARRSAIDANIATMMAFCARHRVELAPHGKTSMAPTLFGALLAAGAWGITVATPNQALVAHRCGVRRILVANEVLDPRALGWMAAETRSGAEFLFYVDSLAAVQVLRSAGTGGRVLVEIGYHGGRTGCRTVAGAVEVARAAAAVEGVDVAGVAGFEGMLPDSAAVSEFVATVVLAARAVAPLCPEAPIVTVGGSAYPDTVVEVVTPAAREAGWRVILRSGSFVTHDDGLYARVTPFGRGLEGSLRPALEVWAQVLSTPEPSLAILGAGKRDLPIDEGMPVPLRARDPSGAIRPLAGAAIRGLNDQHAYLIDAGVRVGELVHLGISHPCTAFDKWRVIPVVDDDYRVVDLLRTYF
jgi:D-serine deaminase-like pyridoxal phosphate-dependent protein